MPQARCPRTGPELSLLRPSRYGWRSEPVPAPGVDRSRDSLANDRRIPRAAVAPERVADGCRTAALSYLRRLRLRLGVVDLVVPGVGAPTGSGAGSGAGLPRRPNRGSPG